jgi:hypothetical protein
MSHVKTKSLVQSPKAEGDGSFSGRKMQSRRADLLVASRLAKMASTNMSLNQTSLGTAPITAERVAYKICRQTVAPAAAGSWSNQSMQASPRPKPWLSH